MPESPIDILKRHIRKSWRLDDPPHQKVRRYVDQFFERERVGTKIVARVVGNHGTYTVSIEVHEDTIRSACSCYIGKGGGCHHCIALAHTFINDPDSFDEVIPKSFDEVKTLDDLPDYLEHVSLEELVDRLRAVGITQKDFAESIGSSSSTITKLKSSEKRNWRPYELGAVKLAVLWALEHFGQTE